MFRKPLYISGSKELVSQMRPPLLKENRPLVVALGFQLDNLLCGCVTVGGIEQNEVSTSKVFRPLLRLGSAAVVVLRYAPFDQVLPSNQDYESQFALREAGLILEMPLLDYLLVGKSNWISL